MKIIDGKIEMKNLNTTLAEKNRKCQHHHMEKLESMNILQVKKYSFLINKE